jgi:hypothetical protein
MGTTGAVFLVKPQMSAAPRAAGSTGAIFLLSPRLVSGIFSAGGSFSNDATASVKAWLPAPRVPLGRFEKATVNGDGTVSGDVLIAPEWYRFLQYLVNDRLGGINAPSIGDVQTNVVAAQQAVTQNVSDLTNLGAVVNANAASLQTSTEVAVQSNLPGASQIPPAQQFKRDSLTDI